jgi:ribonuclease HI
MNNLLQKLINVYGESESLINVLNDINNNCIDIYTDGSTVYDGKNRKSAIGVFFGDNDNRNLSKIIDENSIYNNNECEIIACIEALNIVKTTHKCVNIYTDSRLVVDGMNNQCRKSKFTELLESLASLFISVTWSFVKGHNDTYGNEMADKLSKQLF